MRNAAVLIFLSALAMPAAAAARSKHPAKVPAFLQAPVPASEQDKTLHAMHDELARSMERLSFPGREKPYLIQYRLLDVHARTISAAFGSLLGSDETKNRFMSVDVRVGNYQLDSSNFVSEDGFQGFLGSSGQVGIDRDYHSLRQDLWLATDQAYKAALIQMSLKQSYLQGLSKPPEIADFSQITPTVEIKPRIQADWTSRNWEDEARKASAVLRNYPDVYGSRVNYYLIYLTRYLMTSEGTTVRITQPVAAIEAALDTKSDDGMPLHNYYAVYVGSPADLPGPDVVSKGLAQAAEQLMALRSSSMLPDYDGPVLFDPHAAGEVLSQMLPPSLSGARPPMSMVPAFDQLMDRVGGRSEWSERVGTRVMPFTVSLTDDPTATEFQGQPLLGSYDIDAEGVKAEKVPLVVNGMLRNLLMSRRPGPRFQDSNGHARSSMLSEPRPLPSNLFLEASNGLSRDAMEKKFLEECKNDGQQWCVEIQRMDNPALTSVSQQDFSDYIGALAGGIANGERLPLLVYRVYVSDGHKELARGAHIEGLTLQSLRNMLAVGNDSSVYTYMQSNQFAGTALGAFGDAESGMPSTVVTPSILLDDVNVQGYHGEPRRLPLVPAPPLK
ncbi:MAG TPA: metallopeptidase TldD-related protein [Candidatus Acidoferrales bacterium]|nr:metallopeptidase TldD-related protein [Candidatus Acidoferrales bacterium]